MKFSFAMGPNKILLIRKVFNSFYKKKIGKKTICIVKRREAMNCLKLDAVSW